MDVGRTGEPERREGSLDGRTLRVEDAGLGPNQHAGPQAAALLPSQA